VTLFSVKVLIVYVHGLFLQPNLKEAAEKGSDEYDKKMDRFVQTFREMSVGGRKRRPKPDLPGM